MPALRHFEAVLDGPLADGLVLLPARRRRGPRSDPSVRAGSTDLGGGRQEGLERLAARGRQSAPGAKSDAHVLAEIVRLDHAYHRQVAGDSPMAEAVKLLARSAGRPPSTRR